MKHFCLSFSFSPALTASLRDLAKIIPSTKKTVQGNIYSMFFKI